MANAMDDARQEGDTYRRIEMITGKRRRRQWTGEEKAQIVAESFEGGANISDVARRHGVARGLLTVWRRQVAEVASRTPSFVPVQIGREDIGDRTGEHDHCAIAHARPVERGTPPTRADAVIEIEVTGARILVRPGVVPETLSMVLSALRGIR